MNKKVIMIGAGIAGLSCAARLGKLGFDVEVFEKHAGPGGSAHPLTESGFTFDIIPTFLIMPSFIKEFFDACGEKMEDHLSLRRLSANYKMFYPDGQALTVFADREKTKAELSRCEENAVAKYNDFLSGVGQIYFELNELLYRCFESKDLLNADFLRLIYLLRPFNNFFEYVSRYFGSDKLRWAFSFHAFFLGANPLDAPPSYIIMPYLEHKEYVFYPQGGIKSIGDALYKICLKHGVKFNFNCGIGEIKSAGDKAASIRLEDGREISGDIFISNVDLPFTEEALLKRAQKKHYNYSFSAVQFFFGLKSKVKGLEHHNFFAAGNPKKTLTELFGEGIIPEDPFFYASLPSLTDAALAPEGKDSLQIFIPVPGMHRLPAIGAEKVAELRKLVLDRLKKDTRIDFEPLIECEKILLPADYAQKYNMKNGAIFGLAHSRSRGAFFRPTNFDRQLKNLFYVGASTQPGNSLPLLIASGKIGADLVLQSVKQ